MGAPGRARRRQPGPTGVAFRPSGSPFDGARAWRLEENHERPSSRPWTEDARPRARRRWAPPVGVRAAVTAGCRGDGRGWFRIALLVVGLPLIGLGLVACVGPGASRGIARMLPGEWPQVVYFVPTEVCAVALTIDDGPDAETTPEVLAVLREHDARATFFFLSSRVEGNEALVERMLDEGHELGHHMVEDRRSAFLPDAEQRLRFRQAARALERFDRIRWFRPGSGFYDDTLLELAETQGYRIALATTFPLDTLVPSPGFVAGYLERSARPGSVFVLHDAGGRGLRTAETLRRLLPRLAARGYAVQTLSELDAAHRQPPNPRGGEASCAGRESPPPRSAAC